MKGRCNKGQCIGGPNKPSRGMIQSFNPILESRIEESVLSEVTGKAVHTERQSPMREMSVVRMMMIL